MRNVPTLAPGEKKAAVWWDRTVTGFYLAVYPPSRRFPQGVRSYGVWYRVRGRGREARLGRHPAVGLAAARERAREILEAARVRRVDIAGVPTAVSLADVVEAFISAARKRKPRTTADSTLAGYDQMLKADIRPSRVGRMAVGEVHRRDLTTMFNAIAARAPVVARRVRQLITAACRWAMREEIIEKDPTFGLEQLGKKTTGERALRDDEIAILWRACAEDAAAEMTEPGPGHAKRAGPRPARKRPSPAARKRKPEERAAAAQRAALARHILLTGARPGEAALMEWTEREVGAKLWHVPAAHRKGQRGQKWPHVFPLSAPALDNLEQLHPVTGGGRRVFPWTRERKYDPHWVDPLKERAKKLGLTEPWTAHDLRRTCSTGLSRLGYSRAQIAIVLGHTIQEGGAVTGVYDRFDRLPERVAALNAWGAHVAAVVQGSKPGPAAAAGAR